MESAVMSLSAADLGTAIDALRSPRSCAPSPKVDQWMAILNDESLSREQKQACMPDLAPDGRQIESELVRLKLDADMLGVKAARHRALLRSLEPYRAWEFEETTEFRLERNDCSRLHKLQESFSEGLYFNGGDGEFALPENRILAETQATFVVRHDWAAAFEGAVGIEDQVKIPYPSCAFEFRITGKSMILIALQPEGADAIFHLTFEGVEGVWFSLSEEGVKEIGAFLWKQVKAICIALEAQVAERQVVRAPAALNAKREKNGRPKVADYYVVDLSRRHRVAQRDGVAPSGRHVRMHFRRGHWRHYESHTAWINWMLVGNPDLGFIDKEYRI